MTSAEPVYPVVASTRYMGRSTSPGSESATCAVVPAAISLLTKMVPREVPPTVWLTTVGDPPARLREIPHRDRHSACILVEYGQIGRMVRSGVKIAKIKLCVQLCMRQPHRCHQEYSDYHL